MWPLGQIEAHVGECSVLGGQAWPSIELDNNKSLGPRCLKSGLLHVRGSRHLENLRFLGLDALSLLKDSLNKDCLLKAFRVYKGVSSPKCHRHWSHF